MVLPLHPCWAGVEVLLTFILLLPKIFCLCGKGQQEGKSAFVSATTVHCPAHLLTDKNKTLSKKRAAEVQRHALISFSHNVGGSPLQRNQILALSVMKKFSETQKDMLINTTMPALSTRTPKTGHQDKFPFAQWLSSPKLPVPKGSQVVMLCVDGLFGCFYMEEMQVAQSALCQKKSEQFHLLQNGMERAHLRTAGAEYTCDFQSMVISLCFFWLEHN